MLMVVVLIVGGIAAVYVWSAVNQLLKGQASLGQVALIVLAIAVLAAVVYVLQRISTRAEDTE